MGIFAWQNLFKHLDPTNAVILVSAKLKGPWDLFSSFKFLFFITHVMENQDRFSDPILIVWWTFYHRKLYPIGGYLWNQVPDATNIKWPDRDAQMNGRWNTSWIWHITRKVRNFHQQTVAIWSFCFFMLPTISNILFVYAERFRSFDIDSNSVD